MSGHFTHNSTYAYECVDGHQEYAAGGQDDENGACFFRGNLMHGGFCLSAIHHRYTTAMCCMHKVMTNYHARYV